MPSLSATPLRSGLSSALALALVGLLGACSAGASDTADPADQGEVVNAEDALTAEEAAAGAQWHGDHDELTPDEEAELASEVDVAGDRGPPAAGDGAVTPTSLRALSGVGCSATTGYRAGRPMMVCVTTVNGKEVEAETAKAFARMQDAAKRDGVSLVVVSGFRTMAKQRELYRLYRAGRGNLAAPPGYSNHQSGHALDLNAKARGVYGWLARNGSSFGFRRTVPSESWHWERW
jgi:hypothetical protein